MDGSYLFERAAVGQEWVSLNARKLPPRFLVPPDCRHYVHLTPGDLAAVDFPITQAASVLGRVVAITPGDQRLGLADALIRVRGSHLDVFTSPTGEFRLGDLKTGEITLEVVPWSLPENAQTTSPLCRTIILLPGESVRCSDFVVRLREPNVLQRFPATD
jgi:hypothetical protein